MPRILVCMKAVPGSAQVQVDGEFRLQRNNAELQWNVADESALEAALQLKGPDGHVIVLTMGPSKLELPLKELLARGADRAVLITDPLMAGADTFATAVALAVAVRNLGSFDLIFCGRRTIDGETGQVPGELAAELGIPCITNVETVEYDKTTVRIGRRLEDGIDMLEAASPTIISFCEYSYRLRLPGILAMRKARTKQVEILSTKDLGLSKADCGLKASLTRVISLDTRFPGLRKGPKSEIIEESAHRIAALIREVNA